MDKPWIKGTLILAFLVTLGIVYWSSFRALQELPPLQLHVTAPAPPALTQKPSLPPNPKPDEVDAYLARMTKAVELDKTAVQSYATQVSAFKDDVNARITAAKANARDTAQRLDAYEKVVKNTLATIILTPLLAALILYSGIKVSADVAKSRALNTQARVDAP
jgi:hypothetical protein